MAWHNTFGVGAMQFKCGYCGFNVANDKGYFFQGDTRKVIICPNCNFATFFDPNGKQTPGPSIGNEVLHLPRELDQLYREARNCCSVASYTASVLTCRKILMNIAVQQKAKEGLKFIEYVEFLSDNGYIPPNGKGWVDHIRKKGNEATHEILLMSQTDAVELIGFVEMLLKFVFEFPNRVPAT